MPEYTYKDIIIDPTSEEAKNCIGKEVYFSDNIRMCLCRANKDINSFTRILQKINEKDYHPLKVDDNYYQVIIPKKEAPRPESEYVPFDTIEEFVKASLIHNKDHYLAGTGIWVKEPYDDYDAPVCTIMVDSLCVSDNTIFVDDIWLSLKEVLDSYRFLDDTPCGKVGRVI